LLRRPIAKLMPKHSGVQSKNFRILVSAYSLPGALDRIGLERGNIIIAEAVFVLRDLALKCGHLARELETILRAPDQVFEVRPLVLAQQVRQIIDVVVLAVFDLRGEMRVVEISGAAFPKAAFPGVLRRGLSCAGHFGRMRMKPDDGTRQRAACCLKALCSLHQAAPRRLVLGCDALYVCDADPTPRCFPAGSAN
jgi:hypothetical protein